MCKDMMYIPRKIGHSLQVPLGSESTIAYISKKVEVSDLCEKLLQDKICAVNTSVLAL